MEFLQVILRSPCCVVHNVPYTSKYILLLDWLNGRKLRVRELFLVCGTGAMLEAILVYLKSFGDVVCCIQFYEYDLLEQMEQIALAICTHCRCLISVTFVECTFDEFILDVLLCCKELEIFMLANCTEEFSGNFIAEGRSIAVLHKVCTVVLDVCGNVRIRLLLYRSASEHLPFKDFKLHVNPKIMM